MHRHHKAAVLTIGGAAVLDLALGTGFALASGISVWDGLFMATAIGSTSGYASVPVHGWLPHLLVTGMFITVIPLFTATFSLFVSGMAAWHIEASEARLRKHIETRIRTAQGKAGDG